MNGARWVAFVVAEIPTGYVGDRIGRRSSMVVGSLVVGAMTGAMGLSSTVETASE